MPWDITIVNAINKRNPLGERDKVIARFAASLPGVMLQQPPGPPPEILEMMPPILRENMMRRKLNADFEAEDFSIQFYANGRAGPLFGWCRGPGKWKPASGTG